MSAFSGVVIEEDGGRGGYGGRAPYQGQDRMAMQAPPQAGKGMQAPFEMTQERPGVNVTNAHVDEFAFLHAVEPLGKTNSIYGRIGFQMTGDMTLLVCSYDGWAQEMAAAGQKIRRRDT